MDSGWGRQGKNKLPQKSKIFIREVVVVEELTFLVMSSARLVSDGGAGQPGH